MEYYNDGSLKKSTDARGANATLLYNARGLTTNINYGTPPSGVEATPNVSFSFDSNGNRLTMTDGMGTANYAYDTLSRLTSESRTLTGLSGSFAINYEYYQSTGQLKKITDPAGDSINYAYDLTGRATNITGSPFGGVTNYATSISYRASGATKAMTSSVNGVSPVAVTMDYDASMRVKNLQAGAVNVNYSYFADDKLYSATNPNNVLLNRTFSYYDPKGRMVNSGASGDPNAIQFTMNYYYNEFDNMTARTGRYWWMTANTGLGNSAEYTNHKMTGGNQGTEVYDTEGNMVTTTVGTTQTAGPNKYDVAGRVISTNPDGLQTHYFDGDGNVVKISNANVPSQYIIISRVIGGRPYTILNNSGAKLETSVFGNGQILARQVTALLNQATGIAAPGVEFFHRDPHGTIDFSKQIKWIDPMGVTGFTQTAAGIAAYQGSYNPATGNTSYNGYTGLGNATNSNPSQMVTCKDGYVTVDCNSFFNGIRNGQYSHIWFRTQGLLGFDEHTTQLATSFGAAATTRNGQPTGGGTRTTRWRNVIPGQSDVVPKFEDTVSEDGLIIHGLYDASQFEAGVSDYSVLDVDGLLPKVSGTKEQLETFKLVQTEFLNRLKNPTCASIFGGEKKALKRFKKFSIDFAKLDAETNMQIKKNKITINTDGAFFTSPDNLPNVVITYDRMEPYTVSDGFGGEIKGVARPTKMFRFGIIEAGAFGLFHELGHKSKIYGKYNKDGNDPIANGINSSKIYDACFAGEGVEYGMFRK